MDDSKIEWTDSTFNFSRGCTKISPGCRGCYAEQLVTTRHRLPVWGAQAPRKIAAESAWKKPLAWNRKALLEQRMHRVFPSLCDPFEAYCGPTQIAYRAARDRFFGLVVETPWVLWQLLTKRPENVREQVPAGWLQPGFWPENCWIGASVENQECWDRRWHHLRQIPAPVLFISMEPALEHIDMGLRSQPGAGRPRPDLVIFGGESGRLARPCELGWARSARAQCAAAGVPFFMKQTGKIVAAVRQEDALGFQRRGKWIPEFRGARKGIAYPKHRKGGDPEEWPPDLRIRQLPEYLSPQIAF